MATNLNPISPDALLKIVEQVKEYYVELPPNATGVVRVPSEFLEVSHEYTFAA